MVTCFLCAQVFQLQQEALHPPLCGKIQSISLASFLQCPHFRSCRPELLCKKSCLGPATLLKKRLWHRCFPVSFAKFEEHLFSQNTSSGYFWHLHQSRITILILCVMHQKLRREYVQFFSMVESGGAKDFIFICSFLRIITFFIKV